jgi:hypothetical protein
MSGSVLRKGNDSSQTLAPFPVTEVIETQIDGDPIKPGMNLSLPSVSFPGPDGPEENILGKVFGVFPVLEQVITGVVDHRGKIPYYLGEVSI